MPSTVARGSYYQSKTKRWLEAQGYVVEPLQLMAWIKTSQGLRPVKRDAFASDLLAVSVDRVLFVQAKGGTTWRSQIAAARTAFLKYPLACGCEQVIFGWSPRAREPEIIPVRRGPCAPETGVIVLPRQRRKAALPLFAEHRKVV